MLEPSAENEPSGHAVHVEVLPYGLYVPARHCMQTQGSNVSLNNKVTICLQYLENIAVHNACVCFESISPPEVTHTCLIKKP